VQGGKGKPQRGSVGAANGGEHRVGVGLAPVWLTRFSPFRSCPRQHELARYGRNGKSLIGPFINGVASHTKAMPQAWSPFAKSSHGVAVHHQLLGGLTAFVWAHKPHQRQTHAV
jgi:hypothetical protein